ncbi:MAG TPA: FAD-dependent oxidoreductase, partial [Pyrinomonadaceae bacterium]
MHDVIIIGAGPAGLSAAFWCDELGLDTLVLEQSDTIGGQLNLVHNPIHNYLGLKTRNGAEFLQRIAEDVSAADFDLWTQVAIERIDLRAKKISLQSGEELKAIAIV